MECTSKLKQVNATAERANRAVRFTKQQKQKRTARFDRYAFLKQTFAPLVADGEGELKQSEAIECGFYQSRDNICGLYGWDIKTKSNLPFPFNLSQDLEKLKQQLNVSDKDASLHLVQDACHPARLVTIKTCGSSSVLFYIPVRPMLILCENPTTQAVGELVLSVFAYLYKVVGVPHFSSDYSYLADQYAMLEDWWVNDEGYSEDEQERAEHIAFFAELEQRGKVSLMMVGERENLNKFAQRVENFSANTQAEWAFENTAREFFKLYADYPTRNLNENNYPPFGLDEDEPTIRLEQYLHFFWDFDQIVHQQFMDCINAELNECGAIDEPTTFQYFDTPQMAATHEHDFEIRLFSLLHELTDNLIDLSK